MSWTTHSKTLESRTTFPKVLSDSPDFFRNWAASAAPTFPVFAGSTCVNRVASLTLAKTNKHDGGGNNESKRDDTTALQWEQTYLSVVVIISRIPIRNLKEETETWLTSYGVVTRWETVSFVKMHSMFYISFTMFYFAPLKQGIRLSWWIKLNHIRRYHQQACYGSAKTAQTHHRCIFKVKMIC